MTSVVAWAVSWSKSMATVVYMMASQIWKNVNKDQVYKFTSLKPDCKYPVYPALIQSTQHFILFFACFISTENWLLFYFLSLSDVGMLRWSRSRGESFLLQQKKVVILSDYGSWTNKKPFHGISSNLFWSEAVDVVDCVEDRSVTSLSWLIDGATFSWGREFLRLWGLILSRIPLNEFSLSTLVTLSDRTWCCWAFDVASLFQVIRDLIQWLLNIKQVQSNLVFETCVCDSRLTLRMIE